MKTSLLVRSLVLALLAPFLAPREVTAHCDALDGPVVEAARAALQKGDITPILKWVSKSSEKEIRDVFGLTLKVRAQSEDARKLADMHFFETLVRVHRAGEGEPFTGIKPAGAIDPGFLAADKALRDGSIDEVAAELAKSVQDGLRKRFASVMENKKHAEHSVEAGRAYVAAYVDYAHFVEAIHTITSKKAGEHQHQLHAGEKHGE
jgi:hypothetical protein